MNAADWPSSQPAHQFPLITRALLTGVRSIDMQHSELFELIEAFESAHDAGDLATAVGTLLPHLEAYVIFHFSEEEQLLTTLVNEASYIQMHLAQHQAFKESLQQVRAEFNVKDDVLVVGELKALLRSWLTEHIATTDMTLGRKLLAQGSQNL
jgi:hemerythrin